MPIDERITASPHWHWWIVGYFFLGGLAGGAAFVGGMAALFGGDRMKPVVRWVALIPLPLILVCTFFLIADLGRPERFWHMIFQNNTGLPMFKWWSPMSYGSWIVMIFGALSGVGFVAAIVGNHTTGLLGKLQWLPKLIGGGVLGALFQIVYALFGFGLASYTGALVAATNQPFWSDTPMLGAVFFASGVSTALATIVLLMVWRRGNHATVAQLETADNYAMLIELGMLALFFVFLAFAGTFFDLIGSTYGLAILGGTIGLGMLVPLLLHWQPQLLGRASPVLASVLVLAGGFVLRWALVYAGQEVNVAGR